MGTAINISIMDLDRNKFRIELDEQILGRNINEYSELLKIGSWKLSTRLNNTPGKRKLSIYLDSRDSLLNMLRQFIILV
ncbi:hypothetical protein D3C71_1635520 [compost metagenome]